MEYNNTRKQTVWLKKIEARLAKSENRKEMQSLFLEIKKSKLWKDGYGSWEEYLTKRWDTEDPLK